jgi:hypothetical protein
MKAPFVKIEHKKFHSSHTSPRVLSKPKGRNLVPKTIHDLPPINVMDVSDFSHASSSSSHDCETHTTSLRHHQNVHKHGKAADKAVEMCDWVSGILCPLCKSIESK